MTLRYQGFAGPEPDHRGFSVGRCSWHSTRGYRPQLTAQLDPISARAEFQGRALQETVSAWQWLWFATTRVCNASRSACDACTITVLLKRCASVLACTMRSEISCTASDATFRVPLVPA